MALHLIASEGPDGFSITVVEHLNQCFAAPKKLQELSQLAAKHFMTCNQSLDATVEEVYQLLEELDGFRRSKRCAQLFKIMQDINKMFERSNNAYIFLSDAISKLAEVKLEKDEYNELDGDQIAEKLRQKRCQILERLRDAI